MWIYYNFQYIFKQQSFNQRQRNVWKIYYKSRINSCRWNVVERMVRFFYWCKKLTDNFANCHQLHSREVWMRLSWFLYMYVIPFGSQGRCQTKCNFSLNSKRTSLDEAELFFVMNTMSNNDCRKTLTIYTLIYLPLNNEMLPRLAWNIHQKPNYRNNPPLHTSFALQNVLAFIHFQWRRLSVVPSDSSPWNPNVGTFLWLQRWPYTVIEFNQVC